MPNAFVHLDRDSLTITVEFDKEESLVIKKDDLNMSFFSRGAGGQNVNRHMNGVRLIYRIPEQYIIPEKEVFELLTSSIASRSREANMTLAFTQLAEKLENYFYVHKPRKKTKVPKKAKEKRLKDKKKRSQLKDSRQQLPLDL